MLCPDNKYLSVKTRDNLLSMQELSKYFYHETLSNNIPENKLETSQKTGETVNSRVLVRTITYT